MVFSYITCNGNHSIINYYTPFMTGTLKGEKKSQQLRGPLWLGTHPGAGSTHTSRQPTTMVIRNPAPPPPPLSTRKRERERASTSSAQTSFCRRRERGAEQGGRVCH